MKTQSTVPFSMEQKPSLTVWRNPNLLSRFGNTTQRYNELLHLYNQKYDELDSICREMKQCAGLMSREVVELGRRVTLV